MHLEMMNFSSLISCSILCILLIMLELLNNFDECGLNEDASVVRLFISILAQISICRVRTIKNGISSTIVYVDFTSTPKTYQYDQYS